MSNIKWGVVVTSAPRLKPKLQTTINSLRAAGWNDPIVFSEPDSRASDAQTVNNDKRLGVWHNWLQAANYALSLDVDVIMTTQDDIWIHPESKLFAEKAIWPSDDCGYLSLYTPHHYSIIKGKKKPWGIYPIRTYSVWGAMCLIWHPEVLRSVINTHRAQNWVGVRSKLGDEEFKRRQDNPELIRNLDTAIGYIITKDLGRKIYYCNPSCVQHISEDSSIGGRPATGKRCARFLAGMKGSPSPLNIPIHHEKAKDSI